MTALDAEIPAFEATWFRLLALFDADLEARLVRERAWLKDMVEAAAKSMLVVFRVPHGEIREWSMALNLHEREQVPVVF